MASSSTPPIECNREVRFAVVMYGGVSLAIYINGIAQELFHMVRSTAKDATGSNALLLDSSDIPGRSSNKVNRLSGTERVYRKLSHLLSNQALLNEYREFLKNQPSSKRQDDSGQPAETVAASQENDIGKKLEKILVENTEPINTRFVVDIMSGTSAGGINAIYLAKALANDQQIDQLKTLWLNEGDIALLINDKVSVAGLELENQQPPQSLLNSRRMYLKLLESFDEMEKQNPSDASFESPYVDELDLFITATDLEGLTVPIRLSDSVVYEKRHRHVFHFKYSTVESAADKKVAASDTGGANGAKTNGAREKFRNDFLANNNPFLAFAARCTSSFPFAFEPMRLCDIDDVLETDPAYENNEEFVSQRSGWTSFFNERLDPQTKKRKISFEQRSFGDGGYLDNKPFSYATEMLMRRDAPVPVDRKLIYVEPSPEHPEDERARNKKPDALQNVKAALLDLPTYETIREDLELVIQRNRLIERVNRITAAIERDLDQSQLQRPSLLSGEWKTFDLADMVKRFGIYYLPYRRLRIAAASDELAKLVARIAGLDEDSAHFFAIRVLIRAWRELNYKDYHRDLKADEKMPEPPVSEQTSAQTLPPTANQFLIDFDFKYWLRRLAFIRGKLDQLYRLNLALMRTANVTNSDLTADQEAIVDRLNKLKYGWEFDYRKLTVEQRKELQTVLEFLKFELSDVYAKLRAEGRRIQSAPGPNGSQSHKLFYETVTKDLKLGPEVLNYLLGMSKETGGSAQQSARFNEDKCVERAKKLITPPKGNQDSGEAGSYDGVLAEKLQQAADALRQEFCNTITSENVPESTLARFRALLQPRQPLPEGSVAWGKPKPSSPWTNNIRAYLWRYFSQFDDFDQIRFPILYGTDVGESDVVEIIRISPEDAPSLIAERAVTEKRRKLAGSALFHFGAFLDRSWRQNDIMWGRLDGAERLITALLPDTDDKQGNPVDNSQVRAALIEEAHSAILREEFPQASRDALGSKMAEALTRASAGDQLVDAINKVVKDVKDESPTMKPLEQVMLNTLRDGDFLKFMKSGYEVNRKLDAKDMLVAMSRSTQVIGNIFEDIANKNDLDGKNLAWIARLGKIFWGLVEVAVPNSIIHLLFVHWLKLLYLFEALLLIGGTVLLRPSIQTFGLLAFALTFATNIAVFLLHDEMMGTRRRLRVLKVLAIILMVMVFLVGLLAVAGLLGVQPIWPWMARVHGWFTQPSIWRRWSPAALGLGLLAVAIRDDLTLTWRKYTRWLASFRGEKNEG